MNINRISVFILHLDMKRELEMKTNKNALQLLY